MERQTIIERPTEHTDQLIAVFKEDGITRNVTIRSEKMGAEVTALLDRTAAAEQICRDEVKAAKDKLAAALAAIGETRKALHERVFLKAEAQVQAELDAAGAK